ncbi:MAG TPA: chemotaxis protein CheB, partial [Plasticicumulans sp.]|nr:chemotaxis protein CheB [Plasticicumulans sp.]
EDSGPHAQPAAGLILGNPALAGQTPPADAGSGWSAGAPIGGSLESAGADQDAGEASYVVGIGASAGGLEALERLFRAMPPDTGMAFVVIQHLSPDFKSLMHELLQRFTSMSAVPVDGTVLVRPNTIYLLTPKKDMVIDGHRLISYERAAEKTLNQPINTFFRSLASAWGERGVAVVLSGTGSDGSTGIMDVRETGGLVIAQTEDSSRFDGMPRSAVETGCVDAVLAPEDIPAALLAYADDRRRNAQQAPRASQERNEGIPAIFERLRTVYDIDFNYYKPGTITRRIERRVALHPEHIEIDEYVRHVEQDDAELDLLYKDLLIGVTRFFRDPEAFEILRTRVVPGIVERAPEDEDVRVWVCGCSTGEEAYSLAILFLEAFAAAGRAPRIKILATDIHRKSLLTAGEGVYPESSLTEMPEALRQKYFIEQPDRTWRVTANLRKALIFSEHNLLKDPPFTRIDLVSCRNLLIYLEPPAQLRAIAAFHFALRVEGCLYLGASEGLGELAIEFGIVDRHWKIFTKLRDNRLLHDLRLPLGYSTKSSLRALPGIGETRLGRIYDVLLTQFIPTGILVNDRYEAVHVFGDASRYLLPPSGKVTSDLFSMVGGHLRIALMTALRNAQQQNSAVHYRGIVHESSGGERRFLNVGVQPLHDTTLNTRYYMVRIDEAASLPVSSSGTAADVQVAGRPLDVDAQTYAQIRVLELELQQARESLQSTIEELETSNEELQATNEELLASNEELQSTNEELHSVNEELYSVNAEHELKIQELNAVTSDLNNLISSTELATLFIGADFRLRLFTPQATTIFPLLPQDIGRDLRHFKPVETDEHLLDDVRQVLKTHAAVERTLAWSRERTFLRRITTYQDTNKAIAGVVLTYVDISETSRLGRELDRQRLRLEAVVDTSPNGLLIVDAAGCITMTNPALGRIFGYAPGELDGRRVEDLLPAEQREAHTALRASYLRSPATRAMGQGRELLGLRRDGSRFPVEVSLAAFRTDDGDFVQATVIDISERRRAEETVRVAQLENARLAALIEATGDAIIGTDELGAITSWNPGARALLGHAPATVLGQPLASLFPDGDTGGLAMIAEIHGSQSLRRDCVLRHADGHDVDVAVTISPVRSAAGRLLGLAVVAHEAGERIRRAAERERQRE